MTKRKSPAYRRQEAISRAALGESQDIIRDYLCWRRFPARQQAKIKGDVNRKGNAVKQGLLERQMDEPGPLELCTAAELDALLPASATDAPGRQTIVEAPGAREYVR